MLTEEIKKERAMPAVAGFFGSMNVEKASGSDVEVEEENVLNTISTIDFDLLNPDELKLYGERVAAAILEKINDAAERIARAKNRSKRAADMGTGFIGGKTSKKATATSDALVATNEALHEMNELMRALIVYTQLNGKLSKVMNSAMARMMAEGFKNHSGDLVELNKNGEEFAQVVMQEAEDFASRQLEIELLQQKQAEAIKSVEAGSDQKARVLARQIVELQKKREAHVAGIQSDLTARIQGNMARIESTMNRSDENDALHQRLIDELQQKTDKLNKESTQQDLLLSKQIASMGKIIKSQNIKIRELAGRLDEEAQLNRTNRIAMYVVGGVATVSLVLTGWLSFVSVAA
ncbi:hypothetical protein [Thalassolituus sp.]|jgi:hypothetical protein|uniref:hypothetical protein n=1 Tax=Thalassolituus sp. TaxID=2030822 RepID=UPI0027D5101F|nr:hypothetical protein [Thalassolituus sp.]MDQ4425348.1 hypothetical protein [Thalassolituus sp.]